jgi:hypothetical protein
MKTEEYVSTPRSINFDVCRLRNPEAEVFLPVSSVLFDAVRTLLRQINLQLDVWLVSCELCSLQDAVALWTTLQSLGGSVSARLEVECALVLQPTSVTSNATNLLAVVIRGWIRQ